MKGKESHEIPNVIKWQVVLFQDYQEFKNDECNI